MGAVAIMSPLMVMVEMVVARVVVVVMANMASMIMMDWN